VRGRRLIDVAAQNGDGLGDVGAFKEEDVAVITFVMLAIER
jgi:hypothetical protein